MGLDAGQGDVKYRIQGYRRIFMDLQITGTNIEITPDVRKYAEKKLSKLTRHLNNVMECKVEISEEKTKSPEQRYLVRSTVNSTGAVFHGEERGKDLFMAIDRTAAVMTRQLEDHKGKLYDKGRGSSLARGRFNAEATSRLETSKLAVETMTVEDSIEQLEQAEHNFYLFIDADTSSLKLLYRQKDGKLALIEPQL
jgi:putative sigma-54 modulation protein